MKWPLTMRRRSARRGARAGRLGEVAASAQFRLGEVPSPAQFRLGEVPAAAVAAPEPASTPVPAPARDFDEPLDAEQARLHLTVSRALLEKLATEM